MEDLYNPLMIPPLIKIKYDPSAEPTEDFCSECGKPTGTFTQPHAKDCDCLWCHYDRKLLERTRRLDVNQGTTITFRKYASLETK